VGRGETRDGGLQLSLFGEELGEKILQGLALGDHG
jgi:hypothetical protein